MRHRGFTMIELIAVIIIIGILLTLSVISVTRLINRGKSTKDTSNKNTIVEATREYSRADTSILPKSIGSSTIVDVNTLKIKNYLTEDLTNGNNENCMKYSYVKISKTDTTTYKYDAYLYCGSEVPDKVEDESHPKIEILFSKLEDVRTAEFTINLYGDSKESTKTKIKGYNYSISIKDNDSLKEVYNSGSISGKDKSKITINKLFNDYIDTSSTTSFYISVTAVNDKEMTTTLTKDTTYLDDVPPVCTYKDGLADGEAKEGEWINKKDYFNNHKTRVISVGCNDGNGSGCKRSKFTKSWPQNNKSTEFDYIEIYDNLNKKISGNKETGNRGLDTRGDNAGKKDCLVRVNVDIKTPSATLNAYSGNTKVLSNISLSDSKTSSTISSSSYKNLVNGWMNNKSYKDGVKYIVDVTDDLHLSKWEWYENTPYINSKENNNYKKVELKKTSLFTELTKGRIELNLTDEGMRYGVLKIYDAAGNSIEYIIEANIDRTSPVTPTLYSTNESNKTSYYYPNWSNDKKGVRVGVSSPKSDNVNNFNINLSGHDKYEFFYNNKTYTTDSFLVEKEGESTVGARACDKAGNCSSTTSTSMRLDNSNPTCSVATTTSSWTNKEVEVSAKCSDSVSGCRTNNFSKKYYGNYNKEVGAYSEDDGGVVYDNAGNSATCSKKQIKIDITPPTCETTASNSSWTNSNVTLTGTCADASSGCIKSITKTINYETNSNISPGSVEDKAGNKTECPSKTVKIDKTAPTGSCSIKDTTLTLDSASDVSSGIKKTTYKILGDEKGVASGTISSTISVPNNCGGVKYTAKVTIEDNAGNKKEVSCTGSHTTQSCCSESNPFGCPWTTSCRKGLAFVYTSSDLSLYAGTVKHKSSTDYNKLYILQVGSNWVKVYTDGFEEHYTQRHTGNVVYIYKNCVETDSSKLNKFCAFKTCPDG